VIKRNVGQIKKTLWTDNPDGEPIDVITLRDERDEGADVERIIRENVDRGLSFNQVAVLFRTNAQSLSIEDALRRKGIPYTVVGGVSFYQRLEIKDAVSYLRLLVNPRDDESFLRAVNRPARGIGDVTVRRLKTAAETEGRNLLEMAEQADRVPDLTVRARKSLRAFAADVARWRGLLEDGRLADAARDVLTESGLLVALHDEGTTESMSRWENVQRLLSHIAEYADDHPEASLDKYLQDVSLASDVDSYDNAEDRVTLMTIHSAKGLEFDVVIVPGMEEGLFPVGQSAADQDELEEERRLFYVAVTRARQRLYLTNCERRYRFGELSYPSPSRFLSEIGDQYLRFNSTSPRRRSMPGPGAAQVRRSRKRTPGETAPQEHRSFVPDPEPDDDYSQVERPLQIGTVVAHDQFGRGRVVSLQGSGEKTRIEVQFPDVGKKRLMLKFARLKVVE
jgi:DNA helicase-2/ATP-dependent DNA helicase PcrA